MRDLLQHLIERVGRGESVALCVVCRTIGSTPQAAGAMMLAFADGRTLGTLGGGCVEAEVRTRALRLLSEPQTRLLRFRLDQDYGWDDGLVCGGTMDIAVRIITAADQITFAKRVIEVLDQGMPAALLIEAIDEQNLQQRFEIPIQRAAPLLIAGAGHVGAALAAFAVATGFAVTVIDDRPDMATAEKFPRARCVVGDIQSTLTGWDVTPFTSIVIVTRGHQNDARALQAVVNSPARYIGLIGSKRKISRIFTDLHQAGVSKARLKNIRAPIGLDIGAISPAEIAISVMAELIATQRGKTNADIKPMKIVDHVLDRLLASLNR